MTAVAADHTLTDETSGGLPLSPVAGYGRAALNALQRIDYVEYVGPLRPA